MNFKGHDWAELLQHPLFAEGETCVVCGGARIDEVLSLCRQPNQLTEARQKYVMRVCKEFLTKLIESHEDTDPDPVELFTGLLNIQDPYTFFTFFIALRPLMWT
jgi:hypothetical protein